MNIDEKKTKAEILNLTKALGFNCDLEILERDGAIFANIVTKESSLLTDRENELLFALQQILRIIVAKKELIGARSLILDVNGGRQARFSEIEKTAEEAVLEVLANHNEKTMPMMNSMERMLVHKIVAKHPELMSESSGEGLDRHIVIKYHN